MFDALNGAEWREDRVHDRGQTVGITLLLVDGDTLPFGTFGLYIVLPEVAFLFGHRARNTTCVLTHYGV